ncbi:serine endoprotease DegQ, partial [Vibrio natriegens]
MKKPLLVLSALALGISSVLSPVTASAALPQSVNSQQLPSLAPMLEQVTPAVVSISVEGKQVSKQRLPETLRFF